MFNKIVVLYSTVMIVLFGVAAVLVYQYQTQRILQEHTEANLKSAQVLSVYLTRQYEGVLGMFQQIYGDATLSDELIYFLNNEYENYLNYRLDLYYKNGEQRLRSFTTLLKNYLEQDHGIREVSISSSVNHFVMNFSRKNQELMNENASGESRTSHQQRNPQGWSFNREEDVYVYSRELRDPWTLKQAGGISVKFDHRHIEAWLDSQASVKGRLLVMTSQGGVLYDSKGVYGGQVYPYGLSRSPGDEWVMLDEPSKARVLQLGSSGLSVVGLVSRSSIESGTKNLRDGLLIITLAFIMASFAITFTIISKYSKKVQRIIRSMNRIGEGDLSTRIQMPGEDELQQISTRFNDMGDRLEQYIDKIYTTELKQKQAELVALQAQINPHFLYNTLESIRMKAYVQGAREVGDMIYSLSVMFKSMAKKSTVVTLSEELELCKVYLNLFEKRYEGQLRHTLEADPQLLGCSIIKLLLQPIVENYFVHGFRPAEDENWIGISVEQDGSYILLTVEDNGTGIPMERLEEITHSLEGPVAPMDKDYASIGLKNVHDRIQINYGSACGVSIHSTEGQGTRVILKIPMMARGETA
ncbi:HAMP domain protein [Paenibacillus algicola]|uniref:histidine kinase n=1 Tax=Paenibacillus algicola TaxID=2565926 RepID=A0A4P8XMD6_9BACL|nr:sensor histidine kinase [Paenibacillus algicola]QCT03698.1 HAMP domain protein [Paenibacillus algicola]